MQTFCKHKYKDFIFNLDDKRLQYHFEISQLEDSPLKTKLELYNVFLQNAFPSRNPCDWVCLHSLAGCERQQLHSDFKRKHIELATANGDDFAFPYAGWLTSTTDFLSKLMLSLLSSAIAVLNDGAKLYMCDDGHEKELFFDRGDVLLFRGDAIHSGAEAPAGHFGRIHTYIDSERVLHDRTTDLSEHGCSKRTRTRRSKRLKIVAKPDEDSSESESEL